MAIPLVIGAGLSAVGYSYFTRTSELPSIVYAPSSSRLATLVAKLDTLKQKYTPTWWASGANAQTIFTTLRGIKPPSGSFRRQLVTAPDGGSFGLDWYVPQRGGVRPLDEFAAAEILPAAPKKGILLVLHGLTGSSVDGYCRDVCEEGFRNGFQPVVLVYRGCHELEVTNSPITYSAAYTGDAHTALQEIQKRYPNEQVVAVGFSLGSMVLTKLLSEQGDRIKEGKETQGSKISAGSLVSSPVDMWSAMDKLESSTWGSFYNSVLAGKLKKYAERHQSALQLHPEVQMEAVRMGKTIRDFEKNVILKIYGYKTLDCYYKDGSSHLHYHRIQVPTMLLVARDDPFLGKLPEQEVKENPNMLLVSTSRGGHCAWLEGFLGIRSWSDRVIVEFLEKAMDGAGVETGGPAEWEDGAVVHSGGGSLSPRIAPGLVAAGDGRI